MRFPGFVVCAIGIASGCSSSSTTPSAPSNDAATSDAIGAPTTVVDKGTAIDYASGKELAGITVTEAGQTVVTDARGQFSFTVAKGAPLQLMLSGADYTKTWLAEQSYAADRDRTGIALPNLTLFHVAQGSLSGYDTAKGIVYLIVDPIGACKSVEGGSVTVKSPAGTSVAYFVDKLPDSSRTTFKTPPDFKGRLPVAAIYNVPPGSALDVAISHPTCKQKPLPATVDAVTYSGKVTIEAGDSNSVAFYFLE